MIRKIGTVITLIIILINASCVYSETNKAFMKPEEVQEYMKYMDEPEDVQRAREAIFNSENKIEYTIDTSQFKDFFVDKKYSPKQKMRACDFHSDGTYFIQYNLDYFFGYFNGKIIYIGKILYLPNGQKYEYYYDKDGNLAYILYQFRHSNVYGFDTKKLTFLGGIN